MPPHNALSDDLSEEPPLERGSQYIKVNPEITPKCNLFTKIFHQDIKFTCQVNVKMVIT